MMNGWHGEGTIKRECFANLKEAERVGVWDRNHSEPNTITSDTSLVVSLSTAAWIGENMSLTFLTILIPNLKYIWEYQNSASHIMGLLTLICLYFWFGLVKSHPWHFYQYAFTVRSSRFLRVRSGSVSMCWASCSPWPHSWYTSVSTITILVGKQPP